MTIYCTMYKREGYIAKKLRRFMSHFNTEKAADRLRKHVRDAIDHDRFEMDCELDEYGRGRH